jgi:hypothetical protein
MIGSYFLDRRSMVGREDGAGHNRRPIGLVPTARAGTEEAQWFREVPSAAGDPYHMNVDFGTLRLADLVRHVRAQTAAVAVS